MAVYEQIAENFNNSQDEIHVTVMNIPDEYDTKITSMIAGNDVPEICLLNADTLMYQYAEPVSYTHLDVYKRQICA